jgi:hypothetical protein
LDAALLDYSSVGKQEGHDAVGCLASYAFG